MYDKKHESEYKFMEKILLPHMRYEKFLILQKGVDFMTTVQ